MFLETDYIPGTQVSEDDARCPSLIPPLEATRATTSYRYKSASITNLLSSL